MPNSVRKSSRARVSFVDAYSTHCSELESAVAKHSFEKVESIVQMFWSEAGDKRGDVESDACLAKAAEVRLEVSRLIECVAVMRRVSFKRCRQHTAQICCLDYVNNSRSVCPPDRTMPSCTPTS